MNKKIKKGDENFNLCVYLIRYTFGSIFLFLYDLLIIITSFIVLIFASGIFNIILYFIYRPTVDQLSYTNLLILPITFIICVYSLHSSFPELLRQFIGLFIFKNLRRLNKGIFKKNN
jgi:prepilin signal peptidase PulO-like enzyme (type II secretory pathway)